MIHHIPSTQETVAIETAVASRCLTQRYDLLRHVTNVLTHVQHHVTQLHSEFDVQLPPMLSRPISKTVR